MGSRVTAARIESISPRSDIRHVDELSEQAKESFFRVVREGVPVPVEPDVATEFSCCDVVKYTDYYRITLINSTVSGHVTA